MSDINIQTFSGKVNVANNFQVGSSHFFVDTQNNNVGIGTNNPTHTIDVHGDANVGVLTATFLHGDGSNIQNIASSQWEGSPGDPIYYGSNVGIATTSAPTRTLEVGSNLYVEDTGSNVLVVDGNVAATSITIGDATIVASQGLDHVTNENNTTTQVVQFNNPTTGFVTASNAVIGGTLSLQNFELSQSYGLENVTNVNNTTEDTIISSNATTGFQATANIAVGRDALVTGNVTVGKDFTVSEEATFSSNVTIAEDLEVSGNVTNLDVLSNVNLLSVSNVVSIRKDSNVVTEFPRSKKLIKYPRVALPSNQTSNPYTYGDYTIEVSSFYNDTASLAGSNAFDNIHNDYGWISGLNTYDGSTGAATTVDTFQSINGSWIGIQLPDKIRLEYITIKNRITATIRNVVSGILWAKNTTNSTWYRIHDFSGLNTSSGAIHTIHVNQTIAYDEYRLQITEMVPYSSGGQPAVAISEWELYGIPEYDPDADGVDVKVTSYPNVPNTDWLEVYYDAKDLTGVPTTVLDMSGNSRNGTLNGGVGFDSTYKAFVLDGVDDYIETTLGSHIYGDWTNTVSFWIAWNVIPTSGAQTPFMIGEPSTSTNGIGVDFNANGNMIYFTTSGDVVTIYNVFDLITPGKWIHFTFIHTPYKKYVYWDGKEIGTWTSGGAATLPASPTLSIGRRGSSPTNYTNAKIANFRLFNRALTTDEIYQLYAYQKEYFGHGDLSMTLKAGRLGIGTSEPRAALDINSGGVRLNQELWVIPAKINDTVRVSTNTLSFYEEGSWTPTLGAVATPTYTEQFGYYTRIGNIVHLVFRISVTGLDNSDGSGIHISLPYELVNNNGHSAICSFGYNNSLFDPSFSNGGANIGNNYIIPAQGGSGQNAVAVRYNNCYTSGTLLGFATYSLQVTK